MVDCILAQPNSGEFPPAVPVSGAWWRGRHSISGLRLLFTGLVPNCPSSRHCESKVRLVPDGSGAKTLLHYGAEMADIARITEVVEPEAQALGFDLVRVRYFKGGEIGDEEHTLQIMAERPATGQLVIEDCAALSRRVSDRFDVLEEAGEMLIEEAYRLEVSSPGIDRPLTRPKDFTAWIGHEARIELSELLDNRKRFRGDLVAFDADEQIISIEDEGVVYALPFGLVSHAKLVLSDRLIAASRPLDPSGAEEEVVGDTDEIVEEQED
jgi:ribosome maturation factor RimP